MPKTSIMLYKSNQRKDGSCPVCLRVTKNGKRKYIDLGLAANDKEWNEELARYKKDKRLNPNYENYNALLTHYEERKDKLLRKFAENRVNWTLNQFEEQFLGASKRGKIYDYWLKQIEHQNEMGKYGNARCYKANLHILEKYDKKIKERLFSEIDLKYVNDLNTALIKDGCCGNTKFGYIKALRLMWNRAIKDNEAPQDMYPFGKGGFSVNSLKEETRKRNLPDEDLLLIKNTPQESSFLECTRRLFLFSYYCAGMSFQDMAYLTTQNIEKFEGGYHIVYKRRKLKNQKEARHLKVLITDEINEMLEWFKKNTILVGDYLLPIITIDHEGEKLYNHVLSRSRRFNLNLTALGNILGIKTLKLTSYVARHTAAMVLQRKKVAREVISQVLGHTNLETTNVYLDSFETNVVDEVVKLL